jgi:uncharacterized protein YbbC (DUF1343 family)
LEEPELQSRLKGKRIALAAHPASCTSNSIHSLDGLIACGKFNIVSAFAPQHGMRGEKQDNMIESPDYVDPQHRIPIFSLYGETRRPLPAMMDTFDVLLFDIQDIGCRIYTYITTLLYLMEACAQHHKQFVVLDRPNPAGRSVEGLILQDGWQSFVGAGKLIMRHGLTMSEIAKWFQIQFNLDLELHHIPMLNYYPDSSPGYGWPTGDLPWINPSPNASSVNMVRSFPGTVLLEGTNLSEGRGTTIALEVVGAPDINIDSILNHMRTVSPKWMQGAIIRPCYFEPTFHKHAKCLCQGFQIHTDTNRFDPRLFKPYRLIMLFLKSLRHCYPDYELWRHHAYEYELQRLPFDLINGGTRAREWVDDPNAEVNDIEHWLVQDETQWLEETRSLYLY